MATRMKQRNRWVGGLREDGTPRTLINLPAFWKNQSCNHLQGGMGDLYREEIERAAFEANNGRATGLVWGQLREHGKVVSQFVTTNVELDLLFYRILQLFVGNTGDGSASMHFPTSGTAATGMWEGCYLGIDTESAAAQASSATSAGTLYQQHHRLPRAVGRRRNTSYWQRIGELQSQQRQQWHWPEYIKSWRNRHLRW